MTTFAPNIRVKWFVLVRCFCAMLAALQFLLTIPAEAAISVNRTRLIVTETEREATPLVLNEGARAVLIQAWADTGQAQVPAEQIRGPFIVDPPVFRLEPGQSRSLRVLMVQSAQSLPQDRESVFWFNVLEIPPKPNNEVGANILQVGFRTRIKIFFRPAPIAKQIPPDPVKLKFTLRRMGAKRLSLNIQNPSALHQSFNTLSIIDPMGKESTLDPVMIGPRAAEDIPFDHLPGSAFGSSPWRVRFSTIDDLGVVHDQERALSLD